MKSYYERRSKDEGWQTPFVFSSWLYQDTQTEIYERLTYMIERGVDPVFAIETLRRQGSSVCYPSRQELLAAGVLTE